MNLNLLGVLVHYIILKAQCQELMLVKSDNTEEEVDFTEQDSVSNKDVFIPTNEWQEVLNGQAVPTGLHVRINLETGKKEAKVMEEETSDMKVNHEALKEALKNVKADFDPEKHNQFDPSKFRTMDEIKYELQDVNLAVESDTQVMKRLIEEFKESNEEGKADIVENLEYYVHQYDNALDFLKLDGFQRIILPSLNSTNSNLRAMTCFLMGGAAQSNPQFQIAALESGFVDTFLRLASLDPEPKVATKAFFALSALMRNFPEAQNTFLRLGGLGVLIKVFNHQEKSYDKMKIKILTLIHDLVVEREISSTSLDKISEARKKQYDLFNLEQQVKEAGWCQVLNSVLILPKNDRQAKRDDILSTVSEEFSLRAEHDTVEKILSAMVKMVPTCKSILANNSELKFKLSFLDSQYSILSDKERAENDSDNFFSSILNMVKVIRAGIYTVKSEL